MNASTKARRRLSVDNATGEVIGHIHKTMDTLNELWDDISMEADAREQRVRVAYELMQNLLKDMVSAERKMVEDVMSQIDSLTPKVESLNAELCNEPLKPSDSCPLNSISLMKFLEVELKRLEEEKANRIELQLKLLQELSVLSVRLEKDISSVHNEYARCLSKEEIDSLDKKVTECQNLVKQRLQECSTIQEDVNCKLSQMCRKNTANAISDFVSADFMPLTSMEQVSDSRMEQIRKLRDEVDFAFEEWVVDAATEYAEIYGKLEVLLDKCFVSETQRFFPKEFCRDTHTSDDLQALRSELNKYERLHAERQEVFSKLDEWKGLWAENVNFHDRSASDKNFYNNRGGNLNLVLRRQTEVEKKLLPKAYRELCEITNMYNETHEEPVEVDGHSPSDYVKLLMDTYENEKQARRNSKLTSKRLGSQSPYVESSTPKRRNVAPSPTPRSNTIQQSSAFQKGTFQSSKPGHSGSSTSELSLGVSIISPVHSIDGPRCSSPIEKEGSTISLESTPKKTPLRNRNAK